MSKYRVIEILVNEFSSEKPKESVKWEGSDVLELSKKYPPSEIFGADELSQHGIEGGSVRWSYRFEIEIDGLWVPIVDPRVRLKSGLSDLERAIDAENRRDFPGDFVEYDEDDYFDTPEDYDDDEEDWEGWDEPSGVWPVSDGFSVDEDGYGYPE